MQKTTDDAIAQNYRIMMDIVGGMKEIPELPSEKPNDVSPLEKVEFPDEGGVLTYMGGQDYPYRGFPFFDFVDRIDLLKKIGRAILSGFYHRMKDRKYLTVTLVPSLWAIKDFVSVGIYTAYRIVERFRIKPDKYSIAVKALYDAFPAHDKQLRDAVCMVLEFDNAYRFRYQDAIAELNWDAATKNPRKELLRLLDIVQQREKVQEVRDTWTLLKMFVKYYLLIDREMLATIRAVLTRIDIQKAKLDDNDKWYCAPRVDYMFGFVLKPKQSDEVLIEKTILTTSWQKRRQDIMKESTDAHNALQEQHRKEQEAIAPKLSDAEVDELRKTLHADEMKLEEEFKERYAELDTAYGKAKDAFIERHLLPEQISMTEKHKQQKIELDTKFDSLLKQAEEDYVTSKKHVGNRILSTTRVHPVK